MKTLKKMVCRACGALSNPSDHDDGPECLGFMCHGEVELVELPAIVVARLSHVEKRNETLQQEVTAALYGRES